MVSVELSDVAIEPRRKLHYPLSVRLYEDQVEAIEALSAKFHTDRIDVIRQAVDAMIQATKNKKGK
jgi:hypothetical protein